MATSKQTGFRLVSINTLHVESVSRAYSGLPNGMKYYQAFDIAMAAARLCLSDGAFKAYYYLAKLNEGAIKACPEDYDPNVDFTRFVAYPKNATIAANVGLKNTRSVSRYLKEMQDNRLVWLNDSASRKRTPLNGICLLPGFARIRDLETEIYDAKMNASIISFSSRALTECETKLRAMKSLAEFRNNQTIDELIAHCQNMRKKADTADLAQALQFIQRQTEELKACCILQFKHYDESPHHDTGVTPLTNKLREIEKEVMAWREMELAAAAEDNHDQTKIEDEDEPAVVLTPKADVMVKAIKKIMLKRNLPILDQTGLTDDRYIHLYAMKAAGDIKLNAAAKTKLELRFGRRVTDSLLIQAANDPKIKNGAGWASHFARFKPKNGVIDLRGSFFRMVKDYCDDFVPSFA